MANTTLTPDIIAKEAVMILENECVMAKKVHRGYEDDFTDKVNGYEVGDTISIRRPTDFEVTDGPTLNTQKVTEGKVSFRVDTQQHIGFQFTSKDLTLQIKELSERVIRPALVQLANKIDTKVMSLYASVPSWVGTPGQTIDSFADFYRGAERANEFANPIDGRCAVLSPADHAGLLGSQTALYIQDPAKGAYRKGELGMIGGVDTHMSQNVPTHTTGGYGGTMLVDQALTASTFTYEAVKDTMIGTLHIDGVTAGSTFKAGDVFTIADVYAVNPVSKAPLPFLKQFVVMADATFAGTEGDLTISEPPIFDGAFRNIHNAGGADLNNRAIAFVGAANTPFRQNMVFHKNAFALAMVPLASPPGAVDVARRSYKGFSVRVIPIYDGVNDTSKWRLDVLYGVKAIDPRLAHRMSG